MNRSRRALFADLKQVLWALFLVYLILAAAGWLFGKQIGFEDAFLICLAIAVLVTITFFSVFLFTILWTSLEQRLEDWVNRRRKGS
ncbi:MAG: hypothetical protein A2078_08330 [Nitrospirae bacterium GWC2_57_9]|nr:MAG: hypothetical protein A2078_08330 [Nitrospirae bacterium GWC2_57_9]